ncbi:hypothetical protein BAL199_26097 [alpha proteobacterium BAL199]|jgi:hypothetical protein|nr:hypothetical protein BAL199_26097 [alpha proteobacterium BAL199]
MAHEPEATVVNDLAESLVIGDLGPVGELFRSNGVNTPLVSWTPCVTDISSKPLDFLIEFWASRKGVQKWPSIELIDPVDLRPALGGMLVCEPTDDASDFRIRLYGSRLALEMGRDLTGTFISDFEPDSYITTFYLACYQAVMARGIPLFTRHAPSAKAYAADIKRLLLPFGPPDKVTRILTGVDSVPRRPLGRPSWSKR